MMKCLFVGAITGAAVVMWMCGERIHEYIEDLTINMRERAAARLEAAADRLESVAHCRDAMTRASRFV